MSLRLMKWRGKELNTLSSQMPPRTFCSKQRWTPSESTIKWPSQVPRGQRMAYGHFSLPPTYCPEVCSPRILWQGYLHVLQISRQSDCRTKLYQNLRISFTCSVSCVPFCTEYVQPKDCMEDKGSAQLLSHVWLFATPLTVARQAPLSVGFPRQECWSGLPFPSSGHLPNSGIKLVSPELIGSFFTTVPPGKPFQPRGIYKWFHKLQWESHKVKLKPSPPPLSLRSHL